MIHVIKRVPSVNVIFVLIDAMRSGTIINAIMQCCNDGWIFFNEYTVLIRYYCSE